MAKNQGSGSAKPKGSAAKVGRAKRKGAAHSIKQWDRSANNKLRRINRDRAKSGKPPLKVLPTECRDYKHTPSKA